MKRISGKYYEATECGGEGGKPGPCPEHLSGEGAEHGVGGDTPANVKKGREKLNKRKLTDYQQQTITDIKHLAGDHAQVTTPRFGNAAYHGKNGTAETTVRLGQKDPNVGKIASYAHKHGMEVTISPPDEAGVVTIRVHTPQKELGTSDKDSMKLLNQARAGDDTATSALADKLAEEGNPIGEMMQQEIAKDPENGFSNAVHMAVGHMKLNGLLSVRQPAKEEVHRVKQHWQATEVSEDVQASFRIDKEAGIIYNVLVLGNEFKNGRKYLREAKEDAVQRGLYEKLQVYIGPHKKGRFAKRSPNNHAGELRNVKVLPNNEVRGDLHYNRQSRGGKLVLEIAERFPHAFGLSQHAWVDGYEEDGKKLITEIAEIAVADVVKDPGTTTNIFEDATVANEAREEGEVAPVMGQEEPDDRTWEDCLSDLISEVHDSDLEDDLKLKATKVLMKLKKDLKGEPSDEEEEEEDEEEPTDTPEAVDVTALVKREVARVLNQRPRRRPSSAPRSEAVESVTPTPRPAPPVLTKREDVLAAYGVQ